jgi:two-component system, sensor histidine kinase and response regulator
VQSVGDSPSIDIEAALARVGGDQDLLQEVAQLFLDECPQMVDSIRQAFRAEDLRALEFAAHTLKGAVGNFGARHAFDAALAVEIMARQGQVEEAGYQLALLEKALMRVNSELEGIVSGG